MHSKMSISGLAIGLLLVMVQAAQAEWNGPWPDTGQNTCYDSAGEIPCPQPGEPFFGQDAQYGGPARSYTKLGDGGVELPDNAPHVGEDGKWIMTRDNVTGLIWEIKTAANKDDTYAWQDAQDVFVAGLNSSSFGGFSDWRLPTVKELSTLVNAGILYPGPTINTVWFPQTVSSTYWSSTVDASDTIGAWRVEFGHGGVDYYFMSNNNGYVRAVRAGQSGSFDNFIMNGDGTAIDPQSGLMWQMETAPGTYTWQQALSYAQELNSANYLGHTDWRLPNRNELQSLLDYSQGHPSIDPLLAADAVPSYYWSSTTCVNDPSDAWPFDFCHGYVHYAGKWNSYSVRVVRAGQSGSLDSSLIAATIEPEAARQAGARWRRAGTGEWLESGYIEVLDPGDYTVEFKPIPGWNVPSNQTVSAFPDDPKEITGRYTADFAGGDGTEGNPYQISTAGELDNLRYHLGEPDQYFMLTNDVDLAAAFSNEVSGWEPIGTVEAPFAGTLDGNGHVISNLFINRMGLDNVGLFGVLDDGARISNVGMNEVYVVGGSNVGGLVGESFGIIDRAYGSGQVFGSEDGECIGGLVGLNHTGDVTQSYATASVTGFKNVGGLVGMNDNGCIQDGYATGIVPGIDVIGGLVGLARGGIIQRSYATGRVMIYQEGGDQGGLVGVSENDPTITDSYWNTETSLQEQSAGGTGLSTAQMRESASYPGWEFSEGNVWNRADGLNGGYPYLTFSTLHTISVAVTPENSGSVEWAGGYPCGATARLVLNPETGHTIGWVSGCNGILDGNVYTISEVTQSCSVTVQFFSDHEVLPGSVNGDDGINLADAILALQVVSGAPRSHAVHRGADVDGDGRIGLNEAVFVLQFISQMR
jgi:hypothetical protein